MIAAMQAARCGANKRSALRRWSFILCDVNLGRVRFAASESYRRAGVVATAIENDDEGLFLPYGGSECGTTGSGSL